MDRFEEARRWFMQAIRDLKAARDSLSSANYEWACFQSQQAAEKAAKSLSLARGISPWGHSIVELLDGLSSVETISHELYVAARELDRHYIPSRYPNAFESGYPSLYYDRPTAERAIRAASDIIEWVRERLRSLGVEL